MSPPSYSPSKNINFVRKRSNSSKERLPTIHNLSSWKVKIYNLWCNLRSKRVRRVESPWRRNEDLRCTWLETRSRIRKTGTVIHQGSQSGRAPSAPRKINISCANERWAFLGAKERSVKNGGEGKGRKMEKIGAKNKKKKKMWKIERKKYLAGRNAVSVFTEIIYIFVHASFPIIPNPFSNRYLLLENLYESAIFASKFHQIWRIDI